MDQMRKENDKFNSDMGMTALVYSKIGKNVSEKLERLKNA